MPLDIIKCPECQSGYLQHIQGLIMPQVSPYYGYSKEYYCDKCKHMEVIRIKK